MSGGRISRQTPDRIDAEADVVVIGAGACGLVAALRAKATGAEVMVLERDGSPSGSTSMSSGFVPAPATRFQRAIDVADDTPQRFEADIMAKSKGRSAPSLARLATQTIGPALEWLADTHGLEWIVLHDFLYPGHSRHRMHAVPEKTGAALEARLLAAVEAAEIPIVTEAHVTTLFAEAEDRITAVEITRPDGATEMLGCTALVLACNGFGGNAALVRQHIPEIADGLYYGHQGNTGDALVWGETLGARIEHLSGYQGHGSLAHPHGILISWALMMEGGIQVNADGVRFSNEHGGYSEQAVNVLKQPGGIAWNIYDARLHAFAKGFPDYREAMAAGAVKKAGDVRELGSVTGLSEAALDTTLGEVARYQSGQAADPFGREFTGKPALAAPLFAVKVTGALFHTQGGLMIDGEARVLREDGSPFANLFAGGGAACGVSGPDVSGYLSGNGLLTAVGFGFVAGDAAGKQASASLT
ncbi:fumarate reductase flavoprotein subunit [Hoeflea halophila]|uniref:Fumarate reductase flavoprotein subunit n=1 Tax=Hoeflea halophila TaxID=714899 RepID=A0A286IFW9_9HYPH|nr:FAD-dependent oxidoreductase [Hoeflea halophila]SOE18927.1 fumarate reductase flavoprotein subunit [Hoeflea halophila]